MKIDLSQPICDLDGEPIPVAARTAAQEGEGPSSASPLTLARACVDSLMLPDRDTSGENKLRRYELALKVNSAAKNGGIAELDVKEISLILECAEKMWATAVYGPLHRMLNDA